VIQKYGGTSVADSERIMRVAERIVRRKRSGDDVVVVVSAMANTTDNLVKLAKSIDPNPPEREYDMLLTAGERISMALMSMAIQRLGEKAVSFTGSQSGIVTDDDHTRARIIEMRPTRIIESLNQGIIAIVAGFQGVSGKRDVTTLGRGGSDTTAVALGVALGAEICEIYTDVEGVFSADPKRVTSSHLIDEITYRETLDMAYFGAKVLHSRCVELARAANLPLRVASSMTDTKGTMIVEKIKGMERPRFVGISRRDNIFSCRANLSGAESLRELISALAAQRVHVGFPRAEKISGGWSFSFWADEADFERVRKLSAEFDLEIDSDVCLIALIGEEIAQRADVMGEIVHFLGEIGVEPSLIDATQTSLAMMFSCNCGANVEEALHRRFVEESVF